MELIQVFTPDDRFFNDNLERLQELCNNPNAPKITFIVYTVRDKIIEAQYFKRVELAGSFGEDYYEFEYHIKPAREINRVVVIFSKR